MKRQFKVFVLVLAGRQREALTFAQRRYPECKAVVLSKTELRESGWKGQLLALRRLRGEALLIFTDSLESLQEPMLLKLSMLAHRCRETILADRSGTFQVSNRANILGLLLRSSIAALTDMTVLACAWIGLQIFKVWLLLGREADVRNGLLDVAFLCPSQVGLDTPGGALTHVTGFLSGLVQEGARAAVFSGQPLQGACDVHYISASRRSHLFREAAALAYNIQFILAVRKLLRRKRPRLLYQRHGKFLFAGAVLSRLMGIPLVLEYNASEDWMAKHWDPTRFSPWLRLCERISVKAASLVVVVSNPLKQQLTEAGVSAERILVNPNAVDPEWFHPNCGGAKVRQDLGIRPADLVVCFLGTFSYWHGVGVLEQAIRSLLDKDRNSGRALKFLLIGDGPLAAQLRSELEPYTRDGSVIFTGAIPHKDVRAYLDTADILVSPHISIPGGRPFFGSPTKLFEYMAMGRAIAASALDQIADVLEHGKTSLLVKPGDPGDLAEAIQRLAADTQLRMELGRNARATALARHTWRQNAKRVLDYADSRLTTIESDLRSSASDATRSRSANLARQNPR